MVRGAVMSTHRELAKQCGIYSLRIMDLERALYGIRARIQGDFDNPALAPLGALSVNHDTDVLEIVQRALQHTYTDII